MTDIEIIKGIVQRVIKELPVGRAATFEDTAIAMMEKVKMAGNGNHLEIGVLFGATLIMAALVKDAFNLTGEVVGVDPLCGYYPKSPLHPSGIHDAKCGNLTRDVDIHTKKPVSLESLMTNVYHFHVEHRIRVVKAFSWPWPPELEREEFVSAYIDGDHFDKGPELDWLNVYPRVKVGGLVWFDDWNDLFPAVQKAAFIAVRTPGWAELLPHNRQNFFLIRKA